MGRNRFFKLRMRFIVGAIIGIIYTVLYVDPTGIIEFRNEKEYILREIMIFFIVLFLGELITTFIRALMPSTRLLKYTTILDFFLAAIVWLPITVLFMSYISKILLLIPRGHMGFMEHLYLEIFLHIMLFGIVFTVAGGFLSRIYTDQLKIESRRCKLELCKVISEVKYEVVKVLATKSKFRDCYGIMKHNGDPGRDHFFRITETSFSGKTVVATWKYYSDGNNAKMMEIDLCEKLYKECHPEEREYYS